MPGLHDAVARIVMFVEAVVVVVIIGEAQQSYACMFLVLIYSPDGQNRQKHQSS